MKKLMKFVAGFSAVLVLTAFAQTQSTNSLEIGDKAPQINQEVEDTSGRTLTLAGVAGDKGLLVVFSCNTCPWVAKWEDRYNGLAELAEANDIGMIALNPNERIRNRGESMEDMKKRAQKQDYEFPYALDENHVIADAFGATRTPEVFLFDENLTLVYHGAIDDNADDANAVEATYAADAINQLISGNEISTKETRSLGCTIKRTK
ncbi:thioredoxin family protein [Gracilimonas sediminicola]|uniref:Thioredoxin family protein n=1 Tax=Gracilimonas sediminicola TaxID=2952158 RepID=A0A9X2L5K6_9BACT|nr:thioredoxin family protein [Gracilimonas sediminicola]MCP9292657.1 thioredoxin family protein [Gracilimonas sediminicola]